MLAVTQEEQEQVTETVTRDSAFYDVVILGGGPAGSATALALRQESPQLSVAVIERTTYDEDRIGELLAATAQSLLEQLHVWDSFLTIGFPRASAVSCTWGTGEIDENSLVSGSRCPGWSLNRRCFDRWLADEARKRGAHLYTGTSLQHARFEDEIWHLTLRRIQGTSLALRAGFVVDATGREAAFATRRGAKSMVVDHLVGAFAFFDRDEVNPASMPGALVESFSRGWWYSSMLPHSQLVIGCLIDSGLIDLFRIDAEHAPSPESEEGLQWVNLLHETRYTRDRLQPNAGNRHPVLFPAQTQRMDRIKGKRWLAAGDAAASCDPLASYGINRALCSGMLAGYAIGDFHRGNVLGLDKYEGLMIAEYEDHLKTRSEIYRREQRWKDSLFWKQRQVDVVLNPARIVCLEHPEPNLFQFAGVYLSLRELKLLCTICSHPSPAHEVVAAFRAHRRTSASETMVIAALQQLIEGGVLSCAA